MSKYISAISQKQNYNLIENINKIDSIGKIVVTQKRNNCVFSITNLKGDVFITETPGTIGYKKSNRKNIIGYTDLIDIIITKTFKNTNFTSFQIVFKGICKNKKFILNTLVNLNVRILSIVSEIFLPRNGCKTKKQRRL